MDMYRILFAVLAMSGTAFAALAPADASSTDHSFLGDNKLVRIRDGSQAEMLVPPCWVKRSWKYDYSGKPYLKKVRICA
jgi:hypothetical protein